MNKFMIQRFEVLFSKILERRLLPFIEEHVFDIMDEKNFTHYYREEQIENEVFIRPIFDISFYDLIIVSLIINELSNPEFMKETGLDIMPIKNAEFFMWLQKYVVEKNILFHIMTTDPETNQKVELTFYVMLILDYRKITREGYELLLKNPLEK